MSPKHTDTITDRQSEKKVRRPGRPAFPRELVLAAADALFADADAPKSVSMDDVAAAAGVGKATLFRAFGSRDGLLDALFEARAAPLRAELDRPGSPLGPEAPPLDRILALFDELVSFKFDNPHLTAARELSGMLQAPHYVWMHATLRSLIEQTDSAAAESAESADYTAHVLLGGLRVDVIDELLASGRSREDIRHEVAALVRRVLGPAR
ncbi:TetR family transcriptional regulator [Streptomyces sp. enrichment culture]|uniref:TetR family transcriptional regulator n=1 Tax=Streptomyces sp. enrichment culture TaxID=1795815 RepID=UPI003F55DAF9